MSKPDIYLAIGTTFKKGLDMHIRSFYSINGDRT